MTNSAGHRIIESPMPLPPVPALTLPEYVRQAARQHGERVALVEGMSGRSFTYTQLDRLIGRFAAGLAGIGLQSGDVLLIFAPTSPEWAIAALGAMSAGGVISGASAAGSVEELARQIGISGARFLLTLPALLPLARQASADAPGMRFISLGPADGAVDYFALIDHADPEPAPPIQPGSLAALPCSSGTSGLPKAVMLTHASLITNIEQFNSLLVRSEDAVSLAFLPMFHIFGFTLVLLAGLVAGKKVVTIPRFEPEPFLRVIEQYRVTDLYVVPPIMQFLAAHPMVDAFDLKSVQVIGCGAAPMGQALADKVAARLGCLVVQGYGMTESSGVITSVPVDAIRPGSCGRLVPGTRARVVDPETGRDVATGEAGELWVSGPQMFEGYRDNPAATAATLDGEGWVHTGDIVRFDEDGYIYLTDRLKELIKVNAYQVAPAELEALLLTHPAVADAAVIARPDERAGERPVAYVVFRGPVDADGLCQWVSERVAEYKRLAAVVACGEIPKSPSGKILRRVLRERDGATGRDALS